MYKSRKDLTEEYHISLSTVDQTIRIIRERYPAAVITFGGRIRIEEGIFHEALLHKDKYERGIIYERNAAGTHQTAGRQHRQVS